MGNTTRNTTENTTRNTTTESNNSKAATTTSINSDDAILQLDLNQMNEKKRERKEEEGKLSPNFNLNLSAKKKDRNGKSGKVEKMSSFNSNGGMETGRNTERNSRKTMLDILPLSLDGHTPHDVFGTRAFDELLERLSQHSDFDPRAHFHR